MPESPGLYLRLTVFENLSCFAGLYELPNARERIDRALRAVNLVDRADDPCAALSKGLRQRVGLARALLSDPQVLFLDEPTSGLDPVASREVHELIDGLRKGGVTIFLTTHRLEEAERLCDRVAILNTTLRTIGRPDELREQLFRKTLIVRTLAPLAKPESVFGGVRGVESWHEDGSGAYIACRVGSDRRRSRDHAVARGRPAPTCSRSPSRATRSRTSTSSSSTKTSRRRRGGHELDARPRHLREGAARLPAQPLHHGHDGAHAGALHRLADRRYLRHTCVGRERRSRQAHRPLAALHADHPGDRAGHAGRLLGGRRARAGYARAGAHDAHPRRRSSCSARRSRRWSRRW